MPKLLHKGIDYADLSHLTPVGMQSLDHSESSLAFYQICNIYLTSQDKRANTFGEAFVPLTFSNITALPKV